MCLRTTVDIQNMRGFSKRLTLSLNNHPSWCKRAEAKAPTVTPLYKHIFTPPSPKKLWPQNFVLRLRCSERIKLGETTNLPASKRVAGDALACPFYTESSVTGVLKPCTICMPAVSYQTAPITRMNTWKLVRFPSSEDICLC